MKNIKTPFAKFCHAKKKSLSNKNNPTLAPKTPGSKDNFLLSRVLSFGVEILLEHIPLLRGSHNKFCSLGHTLNNFRRGEPSPGTEDFFSRQYFTPLFQASISRQYFKPIFHAFFV
jgi:hypothetical protein